MPKNRPANAATVALNAAKAEVRRRDRALRESLSANPTEQDVIAAFATFFPDSHMNDRQIGQYARSVVAGRPHFV